MTKPASVSASDPAAGSLAGRYVRETPAWAEMTVSPAPGGRWRVSVSAHGRVRPNVTVHSPSRWRENNRGRWIAAPSLNGAFLS